MTDPPERVRLFVALSLPAAVEGALLAWRISILRAIEGLREAGGESLHLTLCFLGSRPLEEVPKIAAACLAVAGGGAPRLALGDALWLPPRRPGVLAVAVDDLDGTLGRLQASLSSALGSGGFHRPEKRAYRPHVTVARVRRGAAIRPVAMDSPAAVEFVCSEVTLYRSHLERGGARYEVLANYPLAG